MSLKRFPLDNFTKGWFVGNFLPSFGSYKVTEGYIELAVPVIDGLDLNGAVRGETERRFGARPSDHEPAASGQEPQ